MDRWNNELYHHGVLGMRWGHRKREPSRYSRGKQFSNERYQLRKQRTQYLNEKSGLKKLEKRAYDLANKYGLDADDGGGGNTSKYSDSVLTKAGKQYMDIWDKYENIQDRNERLGQKYADQQIIKKYGNTALSDIQHYNTRKAQRAIAVTLGIIGGAAYLGHKIKSAKRASRDTDILRKAGVL